MELTEKQKALLAEVRKYGELYTRGKRDADALTSEINDAAAVLARAKVLHESLCQQRAQTLGWAVAQKQSRDRALEQFVATLDVEPVFQFQAQGEGAAEGYPQFIEKP